MTINEMVSLSTENFELKVFDLATQEYVFDGYTDDLGEDLEEVEIQSFDVCNGYICINIDSEE